MSDTTYTHKGLADLLGVSETTVKSYRRKFPGCIPVLSQGKPIRFGEDAALVATRIRDLFATGMAVEDVRARLATEFEWISEDGPEEVKSAREDAAPELSRGVSNMARSLVSMTQQQKAILERIESLETLLEEAGLADGLEEATAARGRRVAEVRQREQAMEERLNRLDENARDLSGTVRDLAEQLARFLGQRQQAAQSWAERGPEAMAQAAQLAAQTGLAPEDAQAAPAAAPSAPPSAPGATVIPLRSGPAAAPLPPVKEEAADAEPQRAFYSLPLVVRTEQGRYVSAGGRSRGRFSLNDLKAMLIYGFSPPDHFSLRWEAHGKGWWLYLEQERGERTLHMLLMELETPKSGSVAEILKVVHSGQAVHPAEICGIIDNLGL